MSIAPETTPLYRERAIAQTLGLTRDEIRGLRRSLLKKEADWTKLERCTVLTEGALAAILEHLHITTNRDLSETDFQPCLFTAVEKKSAADEPDDDDDDPPPATAAASDLVQLTVVSLYKNRRLLRANDPAGELCDVRVRSNENFRPKMMLHGRIEKPGTYVMEGRCPRSPGRY